MTPPNITEAANYPEPTASDLIDPMFETIWQAIKNWDISRGRPEHLYSGPTGNDVMHILMPLRLAITTATAPLEKQNQRLFDLVRYQRAELHEAGLISDQEYVDLVTELDGKMKGSIARLESYDQLQQSNTKLTERVKELEETNTTLKDWEHIRQDRDNRRDFEKNIQLVIGALDSLGVALTSHNHEWTVGERAIYEEAIKALNPPTPKETN